jgi:hypothetical protein
MEKIQNAMMRHYKLFAGMGLIIVLIAFIFSLQGAQANVTHQSIPTWVPSFKFLGLGIMLSAITMALGLIATTLRNLGTDVTALWPKDLNPGTPEKPRSAKMFPMLMGLIWALATNAIVTAYWANSIANTLNPATEGSTLLRQLGTISGAKPWLSALRYTGMAFIFTAITLALTVIIRTLQHQEKTLRSIIRARAAA